MIFRIVILILVLICQPTMASGQLDYSFDRQEYQQLLDQLLDKHASTKDEQRWVYIYLLNDQNQPTSYYIGTLPQHLGGNRYQFIEKQSRQTVIIENVSLMIIQRRINTDAKHLFIKDATHAPE